MDSELAPFVRGLKQNKNDICSSMLEGGESRVDPVQPKARARCRTTGTQRKWAKYCWPSYCTHLVTKYCRRNLWIDGKYCWQYNGLVVNISVLEQWGSQFEPQHYLVLGLYVFLCLCIFPQGILVSFHTLVMMHILGPKLVR